MNLIQRLINRRLMSEAPPEGGEGGGGGSAAGEPGAEQQQQSSAPRSEAGKETVPDGSEKPPVQKTEDELAAEKAAAEKAEKEKKPEGAPEKYEFSAPEGSELDQEVVKQFEPIARELNLNQEQAQKLVDLYGSKVMPQLMQQQAEVWQKQVADWGDAVKTDKEIGGDKFDANLTKAKQALDKFGSPELRQFLETSGMGNNPELIRAFYKVGAAMSEDTLATSNETGQRSAAEVLYGK